MMTREEAYTELTKYVDNKNLLKHMVSWTGSNARDF